MPDEFARVSTLIDKTNRQPSELIRYVDCFPINSILSHTGEVSRNPGQFRFGVGLLVGQEERSLCLR